MKVSTPNIITKERTTTLTEKVVEVSSEQFINEGIKSVTMSHIASQLKISKKTLYHLFPSKEDLIFKCVSHSTKKKKEEFSEIMSGNFDAIEEMMHIGAKVINIHQQFDEDFIYDLERLYPRSWKLIKNFKQTFIKNMISNNIKKGIQEKLYRKELDEDIVSRIYVAFSNSFTDTDLFEPKKSKMIQLFRVFFEYHVHGIATKDGIKRLHQLKNKIKV